MNKKIPTIFLIVGILLVIIGISLTVLKVTNNDSKNKKEKENKILEEYEKFRNKVDNFNSSRDDYYNKVAKNLYPESVENNYENWISTLDVYTKATDEVEEGSSYLKDNCVNTYYSNNDVKNKCDAFVIAYETAINYYTKDVYAFNDNLNLYRRNNINSNSNIIDYELKYNYVDIDSDGKFWGKD
mgnify:FL=1